MGAISFVMPAKNEAAGLSRFLPRLREAFPDAQILVVDDGSTDSTVEVALNNNAEVISHKYSKGNGAAIKTGARHAGGEIIVFMDADGQHQPEDAGRLIDKIGRGYDLVVGERDKAGQASFARLCANGFYNRFASWVTGRRITDLTSGFRAVNAKKFRQFLYLYPNGFSYPTTNTLAFIKAGYSVTFEPINVLQREGSSHISLGRDGIRFVLIIFKIGTLFSPLKIFLPSSLAFFSGGLFYYIYTYLTDGRFTNMGALLFSSSVMVFLMGLISEQITTLIYQGQREEDAEPENFSIDREK